MHTKTWNPRCLSAGMGLAFKKIVQHSQPDSLNKLKPATSTETNVFIQVLSNTCLSKNLKESGIIALLKVYMCLCICRNTL